MMVRQLDDIIHQLIHKLYKGDQDHSRISMYLLRLITLIHDKDSLF